MKEVRPVSLEINTLFHFPALDMSRKIKVHHRLYKEMNTFPQSILLYTVKVRPLESESVIFGWSRSRCLIFSWSRSRSRVIFFSGVGVGLPGPELESVIFGWSRSRFLIFSWSRSRVIFFSGVGAGVGLPGPESELESGYLTPNLADSGVGWSRSFLAGVGVAV